MIRIAPATRLNVLVTATVLAGCVTLVELFVLVCGQAPAHVLAALVAGTWGNGYGIGQVVFKATPLVFTGLAVALPFRAGLFNVGAEGQAVLGALAIGLVGAYVPPSVPGALGVAAALAAGALTGGLWGALPGVLRARAGASEVVSTLLLNFVALGAANWLLASRFAVPETLHTLPITDAAQLDRLSDFVPTLSGSAASMAFPLALAFAALAAWWLFRTAGGHAVRATGLNPEAARAVGIPPGRVQVRTMAIGGALAGLAGAGYVLGFKGYYEDGFMGGAGFMGIAVAVLARNHPLWVVPAALLFGTLSQGGLAINALVPKELVDILQAVIILAIVSSGSVVRRLIDREGGT